MQNTVPKPTSAIDHAGESPNAPLTRAELNTRINYKRLVGVRIKQLRSNAEMTQDALSDRCGIFRTYLSRIESGSANPTLVVLVALAESLGVEPAVLFREN